MADECRIELNEELLKYITTVAAQKACYLTIQDVRTDVDKKQTVPFRDGTLDNSAHNIDGISSEINETGASATLSYNTPYALKQYYEPMNHYTGQHANATDHWLEEYKNPKNPIVKDNLQRHLNEAIKGDR